jgi:hypothetical protein
VITFEEWNRAKHRNGWAFDLQSISVVAYGVDGAIENPNTAFGGHKFLSNLNGAAQRVGPASVAGVTIGVAGNPRWVTSAPIAFGSVPTGQFNKLVFVHDTGSPASSWLLWVVSLAVPTLTQQNFAPDTYGWGSL